MTNYDKQDRKLKKLIKELDDALARAESAEAGRIKLYRILDGIMHETRRLNAEVANSCEEVSKCISNNNYAQAGQRADDAFYMSGLISSRLTFADFEINPDSLSRQVRYSAGLYRKFDKARQILFRAASRRGIEIQLHGPSRNEIDVMPAFELVPFVLIDNAVKYSPDGQIITIEVQDNPMPGIRVQATVQSIGPMVTPDELCKLCLRGYRGQLATQSSIPGEGIGLYLAETLVRLVNGSLQIRSSSNSMYGVGGVDYSEFEALVNFR
ncbi:ATP-binding protein [Dokdonella sp.]|uniref:ATP-binding protein n=1 Tax=Dokdonella sp. TaxID=2291710 RepID=UPI0035287FE6